ncbi:MAG TPA: AAA family ATPase [Nocardioides sp.]|nr:AAA family ATPase [Nocardioides sp.]
MGVHGREREQAAIGDLLAQARAGRGGSLVLTAEAGAGKTALLAQAAAAARDAGDLTVVTTSGIESEAPLAFAALQRLLAPLSGSLDRIPAPQSQALRVVFGMEAGDAGDRFLIFLGVLSLLADAGERQPVLVVVDDAQWLDEASAAALQFVARRIALEPVALLWAARENEARPFDTTDLPTLRLPGLGLAGAAAVLAEQTGAEVSPEVAALLVANTGGNPLALRELPSVLTPGQLAGTEPLPPRLPVTERIERVFLDRARRLTPDAQTLLLVASADDSTRLATVLRAAEALGTDPGALGELERSGLVAVAGDRLSLRHPLVRSAVYDAAPSTDRRRVHAALADVLTRQEDADRRAWHRSSSVVEPDASVVAELVAAAERAGRRGGHEAASAAWERAAELDTDPDQRARHLFAASAAAWASAHPDRARDLIEKAITEARDPLLLADARRLRGRVEWNTGSVKLANRMLLEAAVDVAEHDPARARELAAEAVAIAPWGGASGSGIDGTTVVPPPAADAPARERTYDELLRGCASVAAGDYAAAAGPFRRAFALHEELTEDFELLPNLSICAFHIGELDRSEVYMQRVLTRARNDGAAVMVLYTLTRLALIDLAAGRWTDAVGDATEAVTLGEVTGHHVLADTPAAVLLLLAAHRGDDEAFTGLIPRLDEGTSRSASGVLDVVLRDLVHWAHGVHLALTDASRPASAFHRFAQMSHDVQKRMAGIDRIEAAVRADQSEAARLWAEDLAVFAAATGLAWPAAVAEHGHALLAAPEEPDAADDHFQRALELHEADAGSGGPGWPGRQFNRARTRLAYGEFLRRSRRRVDARAQLRAALDTFEELKARPWAERAATELRASGETVRRRDETAGEVVLTPQERQVAQLVRKGMSNKDVAAQLFVSPRTVDFHLRNVFTKTGVSSRGELVALDLG